MGGTYYCSIVAFVLGAFFFFCVIILATDEFVLVGCGIGVLVRMFEGSYLGFHT